MFQCKWNGPNGLSCYHPIHPHDLSSHLREVHGIRGSVNSRTQCIWDGCNREFRRDTILRHINEVHGRAVRYSCDSCGRTFKRPYILNEHRRIRKCTVISSSS
ncbi:hypothetical protein C8R48DRAFT_618852 [Suillus tomentosus]|nr:hypothetical protein C8R48DRAFT_618852 [Suillus tomentosus]